MNGERRLETVTANPGTEPVELAAVGADASAGASAGLLREVSESILLLSIAAFTLAGYLMIALAFVGVMR
ncbi:MAG: hypothetical protein ACRDJ4_16260 [Actinomycetota bacterium]